MTDPKGNGPEVDYSALKAVRVEVDASTGIAHLSLNVPKRMNSFRNSRITKAAAAMTRIWGSGG